MNYADRLSQIPDSGEYPAPARQWTPERVVSDILNLLYRRPLLQVLISRGIAPHLAQGLIDMACLQAGHEICAQRLDNQPDVQRYLYRLICVLALSYQSGGSRQDA